MRHIHAAGLAALILLLGGCSETGEVYDFDGDGVDDAYDCAPEDPDRYPGAEDGYGNGVDENCDGGDGVDLDGDGYPSNVDPTDFPELYDCNDTNPAVHPGAEDEVGDLVDHDCDGHDGHDGDGDGFASEASGGDDCDDEDAAISPVAPELCGNGLDDDCSGAADDRDRDGDGALDQACGGDDCDDENAASHPGAEEIYDFVDNDCDGLVDEDTPVFDDDGDGYAEIDGDCDDADAAIHPGAVEICDGLTVDEDCSGTFDDKDADGDGFLDEACGGLDCDDGDAAVNPAQDEICANGVDDDCSGAAMDADLDLDGYVAAACDGADCDDTDFFINPSALEICGNAVDEDCSGQLDDRDQDGDGYPWEDCQGGGDCDDLNPNVNPGEVEVCDGLDNDCDAGTDEYTDGDGDGVSTCQGDCDDTDLAVYPGLVEVCDGRDNDCDGVPDNGCLSCDAVVPIDHPTIQAAIDAAFHAAVVCVLPGTYAENLAIGPQDVVLRSTNGPAETVIDGGGLYSVVVFGPGTTSATVLEGFTVTHGAANQGGGLYLYDADPTLVDLVVEDNTATLDGGGLYLEQADPLLQDSLVRGNVCGDLGGGLVVHDAQPTLLDVVFEDNEAALSGGGLAALQATLSLERVTLSGNRASTGGGLHAVTVDLTANDLLVHDNLGDNTAGGISLYTCTGTLTGGWFEGNITIAPSSGTGGGLELTNSQMTLSQLVLVDNTAVDGGGIYVAGGTVDMHHLLLAGNEAIGGGGGVRWNNTGGTAENLLVVGNEAPEGGGAYLRFATTVLRNVAFVRNTASGYGGALFLWEASPALVSVDLSLNSAGFTQYNGSGMWVDSGSPTFSHCNAFAYGFPPVVTDEGAFLWTGLVGVDGNLEVDPAYLDWGQPDPLAMDLHLGLSSPLIDAGHPAWTDPDISLSDIGAFGGPGADDWDLDGDGAPLWWRPGAYDPKTSPGMDCDDMDDQVGPGNGC